MGTLFEGKIAVVTGGTRGIGRAISERLAKEGAAVAICGRAAESAVRAARELSQAAGGTVEGFGADVTRLEDVRAFYRFVDDRFGGLDILVNNAGIGEFASVGDLAPETWSRVIDTNLTGAYYFCHEAIPRFRNRGGGFIINVSSLAGKNAFAGGAAYNASKFALNGFTEALMLDHRYDGIRVSCVMPGSVDTEFQGRKPGSEWRIAPEDVAEVVVAVLKMPERTMVSRVEMRPSRPAR